MGAFLVFANDLLDRCFRLSVGQVQQEDAVLDNGSIVILCIVVLPTRSVAMVLYK